jgi:hypothetical protein
MRLPHHDSAAHWFQHRSPLPMTSVPGGIGRIRQRVSEASVPGSDVPGPDGPQPAPIPPIKLPNPPDEIQPEIPKVGSRDAPGG